MSAVARRASVSSLLPILIVAIILILFGVWWSRPGPSLDRDRKAHGEILSSMTGLARPVSNKLSAQYADADGDLVADPPTDAAKQVDPPTLTFSYVASAENAFNATAFAPLTEALAKATGRPVRFLPLTDVDEQIAAMHDGTLHICAFNTGAVPVAVDVAGFVPVSVLGGASGPDTYRLMLIASRRTGIADMKQIVGEEITLTEMGSNSGFKAPLVLLHQEFGLVPGRDYAIRYSGGHQQSIQGLANGTYDVIAVASDILVRAERAQTISPSAYRVLYSSDSFPTACFGYSHVLKPELARKIDAVLGEFTFTGNSLGRFFAAPAQTRLVRTRYATDFQLVRHIDDAIGYEHKLRRPQPSPDATSQRAPASQPAE